MKTCSKHGVQSARFSFCPFCGHVLVENYILNNTSEYTLPEAIKSETPTEELALFEARSNAWTALGIHGNVASKLAKSTITPKELKEVLSSSHIVKGIGKSSRFLIAQFDEQDEKKFNDCYEKLKKEGSWTWNLARWFYSLPDGCTNGEYEIRKNYFKSVG